MLMPLPLLGGFSSEPDGRSWCREEEEMVFFAAPPAAAMLEAEL